MPARYWQATRASPNLPQTTGRADASGVVPVGDAQPRAADVEAE
jgi:hypothetical protein